MKQRIQGIIIGFMAAILFSGITVWAATGTKTVEITYNDIKINLDGKEITPKDANGNVVEPFIMDGSTYLPVRAVAEALGNDVNWDGDTNTVIMKLRVVVPPITETPITETKKFEGRLDNSSSIETYDFTLPYASRITLDFEHKYYDSSHNYWNIQIISKKYDEKIDEFNSNGKDIKTSNGNALYLPAGEYYFKVSPTSSSYWWNTDYTLTVTYEKNIGQYETEKNNTMDAANQIYLDKAIIGNTFPSSDVDYYKFTVDTTKDIYIYFEHNYIDSNDDYWNIQIISKNYNEKKLEFHINGKKVTTSSNKIDLEPGEYYVRVSPTSSSYWWSTDYTLTVKTQ